MNNKQNYYKCPNCGNILNIVSKHLKMVKCYSCNSTISLNSKGELNITKSVKLREEPSLIKLNRYFKIDDTKYYPAGKIRYSYGRGFWEEWFVISDNKEEYWLSVDEGEFILEQKKKIDIKIDNPLKIEIGTMLNGYVVQEKGQGECVGFEGELPKFVKVGDIHSYLHLDGGYGKIITYEYSDNEIETFEGNWIDTSSIKVNFE